MNEGWRMTTTPPPFNLKDNKIWQRDKTTKILEERISPYTTQWIGVQNPYTHLGWMVRQTYRPISMPSTSLSLSYNVNTN